MSSRLLLYKSTFERRHLELYGLAETVVFWSMSIVKCLVEKTCISKQKTVVDRIHGSAPDLDDIGLLS
jgi:hypothetical protein